MAKFRCIICSFVQQGWKPPSHCPICGAASNMFEETEGNKEDGGKDEDRNRNPKQ